MTEVIGVVEQGQIKLPSTIHLSEGQQVRVAWEDTVLQPPEKARSGRKRISKLT